MNLVKSFSMEREKYQLRYANMCKKIMGSQDRSLIGAMHEMSYVLINVFGLTDDEVSQVEKNGGFTDKELYN